MHPCHLPPPFPAWMWRVLQSWSLCMLTGATTPLLPPCPPPKLLRQVGIASMPRLEGCGGGESSDLFVNVAAYADWIQGGIRVSGVKLGEGGRPPCRACCVPHHCPGCTHADAR